MYPWLVVVPVCIIELSRLIARDPHASAARVDRADRAPAHSQLSRVRRVVPLGAARPEPFEPNVHHVRV